MIRCACLPASLSVCMPACMYARTYARTHARTHARTPSELQLQIDAPLLQVAGQDCTQDHVFETVGRPSCEACLEGFNSTVFAYGQTGAGKTFTMQGHDTDDKASGAGDKDRGLIPRVFDYLFNRFTELKAEGVEVRF
jgi:hypothetical protein